jgi:hypothetical protein
VKVVKFTEEWAVAREQEVHAEALLTYGERCVIRRVWSLDNFLAGEVDRCTVCIPGADEGEQALILNAGKQAGDENCTNCFGTGFEGGFQPVIYVTYMLADDEPANWKWSNETPAKGSGRMRQRRPSVQFPWEPTLDEGDLVVRVRVWDVDELTPLEEEERYTIQEVENIMLRTGLALPTDSINVAQRAQVMNLSQDHIYRTVPIAPGVEVY